MRFNFNAVFGDQTIIQWQCAPSNVDALPYGCCVDCGLASKHGAEAIRVGNAAAARAYVQHLRSN